MTRTLLYSPVLTAPLGWRLWRRRLPGVAVLCYHAVRRDDLPDGAMAFEGLHVRASTLAAHCRAIRRYCHPISLEQWRAARAGQAPLPARPILVSFDDGYRSVLTEALPALERYQVPAVVFLSTAAIARGEMFWYDAVAAAQGEGAVEPLKSLPYDAWRQATCGLDRRIDRDDPRAPFSAGDVATLGRHPLIEIGGHTENHPILALAPVAVQTAEIEACGRAIREWTGRDMRAFAYPNGRLDIDLSDDTRRSVAAAGVDMAFTTERRYARTDDDPRLLPRFPMTSGATPAHLLSWLHHAWT